MTILEHMEFRNSRDDSVDVRLVQFGKEFQVIVNVERTRRTTEKRHRKLKLVELSVMKFTHEVEIIKTAVERTARVEYNMRRALNGDPSLSMAAFQEWLRASDKEQD